MILKSDLITSTIITKGFKKELLGPISHDLTISKIIISKKEKKEKYILKPNETIFIECEQAIELPTNLIGIVHGKNSRIRQGLNIISPIYQPGHKTVIFFRITNISSDEITIKVGDKIAQISFEEVKGDSNILYDGEFQNEFNYKGLGKYDNEYLSKKIDDKIEKIEDMERKIYAGVTIIITILIALFGFFNAGIKIQQDTNMAEVFFLMSLSLLSLVTLLFGIVGAFFTKRNRVTFFCLLCFVCSFLLLFKLYNKEISSNTKTQVVNINK